MNNVPTRDRRRHLATAGSLALIALLAVGCGDDGGEPEAQETETVVVDVTATSSRTRATAATAATWRTTPGRP